MCIVNPCGGRRWPVFLLCSTVFLLAATQGHAEHIFIQGEKQIRIFDDQQQLHPASRSLFLTVPEALLALEGSQDKAMWQETLQFGSSAVLVPSFVGGTFLTIFSAVSEKVQNEESEFLIAGIPMLIGSIVFMWIFDEVNSYLAKERLEDLDRAVEIFNEQAQDAKIQLMLDPGKLTPQGFLPYE